MKAVTDYRTATGARVSLPAMPGEGRPLQAPPPPPPPAQRQDLMGPVLAALRRAGRPVDVSRLAAATGLPAPDVRSALYRLERRGQVVREPQGLRRVNWRLA